DSTDTGSAVSDSTDTGSAASDSTQAEFSASAEKQSVVLKVKTDPESATLSIDGKKYGLTPATVTDLDTGSYSIELSKSGHYRRKAKVRIETYGLTELDFELLRPAVLVIQSDPPEASVSIDGKPVGETPYENKRLRPGEHTITLSISGFEPVEKKITLESGGSDTLALAFETEDAKVVEGKKRSFFNPGIVLISFFIFTAVLIGIEKTSL
ncbi:MAG: PEGA domain-containing protein, partial [Fibrobacterota bacterium]